jgi:restriction system protein
MSEILEHYPPQLVTLITEVLPILFVKRKAILLFFKTSQIPDEITDDIKERIAKNEGSLSKYMMIRTILYRLNNNKENAFLRERYEILKRLIEFEDFNICWPDTVDKAKGLIDQLKEQDIKNNWLKDMETTLMIKRIRDLDDETPAHQVKIQRTFLRDDLLKALSEQDERKRGKDLVDIFNHLFALHEILIIDPFKKNVLSTEGLIEQIDGVVEINKEKYLVELKWSKKRLGLEEVSNHFMNVFYREKLRGILIGVNGFEIEAIDLCKKSYERVMVVLWKLEELLELMSKYENLNEFLQKKIEAAIRDNNPLFYPLGSGS